MYREHRQRFLAELAELGTAAVVPTATLKTRNNDCTYRFRPDSDFWYLTGFKEPGSVLVLLPDGTGEEGSPRSVMFLRELDRAKEIWTGRRLGVERAPEVLGVDEARDIETLWETLPELLKGYGSIMFPTGLDAEQDREMLGVLARLRAQARAGVAPPQQLVDPSVALHELRLFKTDAEVAVMEKAAAITHEAHVAAMRAAAPGISEGELEALLDYTFRQGGGTGAAYESIVAGGDNACILHYIENDQPLQDGDLCLIDAGCEYDYYASDVTRTFPVNGRFSAEQKALYELVLAAQLEAISRVAPGVSLIQLHEATVEVLVAGLVELGLLEGPAPKAIEEQTYLRYYMHKTGHYLGLDVHDRGAYSEGGEPRRLAPGMITTVEPGLYIAADEETVEERWRGIGIRIEDDILVTASGYKNLTEGIPKTVEEVEAACAGVSLVEAAG